MPTGKRYFSGENLLNTDSHRCRQQFEPRIRPRLPQGNHKFFRLLNEIRNFEETGNFQGTYTNGIELHFLNGHQRDLLFENPGPQVANPINRPVFYNPVNQQNLPIRDQLIPHNARNSRQNQQVPRFRALSHDEDDNAIVQIAEFQEQQRRNFMEPRPRIEEVKNNNRENRLLPDYDRTIFRKTAQVSSCSICIDDLRDNDIIIRLKCFHVFHENCIVLWSEKNNICPECRLEM